MCIHCPLTCAYTVPKFTYLVRDKKGTQNRVGYSKKMPPDMAWRRIVRNKDLVLILTCHIYTWSDNLYYCKQDQVWLLLIKTWSWYWLGHIHTWSWCVLSIPQLLCKPDQVRGNAFVLITKNVLVLGDWDKSPKILMGSNKWMNGSCPCIMLMVISFSLDLALACSPCWKHGVLRALMMGSWSHCWKRFSWFCISSELWTGQKLGAVFFSSSLAP